MVTINILPLIWIVPIALYIGFCIGAIIRQSVDGIIEGAENDR